MVFGRVVRPPSPGAELIGLDDAAVRAMPGVLSVVRQSSFLGVVAEREEQAIRAAEALRSAARWRQRETPLPDEARLPDVLGEFAREDITLKQPPAPAPGDPAVVRWVEATYSRPYLSHGSIGPSCAVAVLDRGRMTVWSHTQGVYPLRGDMAIALGMRSEDVDVIHVQAAGCYGHNGADDAAFDAALLAREVPKRPVKLQWSRQGRVRLVTGRAGDDDARESGAVGRRKGRRLELRPLEQLARDAPRPTRRSQPPRRLVSGQGLPTVATGEDPAAVWQR